MGAQIKSKERVKAHGEVFTAQREVNAMLDLVQAEAKNIDSTFMEPACGDGNFLVEILRRKLDSVFNLTGSNDSDCEYWATRAFTTIYGVDVMMDNTVDARLRLYDDFFARFVRRHNHQPSKICRDSILFILSQNIQCGDTLQAKTCDGNPLLITQWSFGGKNDLTISQFSYAEMVASGSCCHPIKILPTIPYCFLPAILKISKVDIPVFL